jgi:hypothetical protein
MPQAMLWSHDAWFLGPGVIIAMGTRDAQGRPTASRVIAAQPSQDLRALVLFVAVPEGLAGLVQLSDNGQLAVGFTRVTDYRSMQLKGTDARIVAAPDAPAIIERHVARQVPVMAAAGVSEAFLRSLWSPEAVAVRFTPEGAWDQTPGPTAGRRFEP